MFQEDNFSSGALWLSGPESRLTGLQMGVDEVDDEGDCDDDQGDDEVDQDVDVIIAMMLMLMHERIRMIRYEMK